MRASPMRDKGLRSLGVVLITVAGAALLCACTQTTAPLPRVISSAPSPSVTSGVPSPTPTSASASASADSSDAGGSPIPHRKGPLVNGLPHDYGPILGARGKVLASKGGAPYRYRVVSGDRLNEIAHRFGYLNGDDIVRLNVAATQNGNYVFAGQALFLQQH